MAARMLSKALMKDIDEFIVPVPPFFHVRENNPLENFENAKDYSVAPSNYTLVASEANVDKKLSVSTGRFNNFLSTS